MAFIQVKDLVCSYSLNPDDKVLHIADLKIEKGKIIFLLGASGSGKSTFLETLGLMNNTLAAGDIELDRGDRVISFASLWKEKGNKTLNEVRRKNLSFIFQNTNLMENFTAYENICLSQMIKEGSNQKTAMEGAQALMNQVGLPLSEVSQNKLSVNLSGGQRQRVSFARALNNNFSLLLCDEPTGNLDEINARELLKIIRENIAGNRSAIVVSHDVNLALQFADQIIVISKDPAKKYGEILNENIYNREQWQSLAQDELRNFREKIVSFFRAAADRSVKTSEKETSVRSHKTYKSLFLNKESRILFGKANANLLLVTAITLLTLLASGFASGALDYIERKYNDPFVNWLTIRIPDFKNSNKDIQHYTKKLNEQAKSGRFAILQTTTYKDFWLPFFDHHANSYSYSKGRTIAFDDPLLGDLLGPENLVRGIPFRESGDLSVILTEKMLQRMKYETGAGFIYMNYHEINPMDKRDSLFKVPVPVRAVVKSIPGKLDFLVTEDYYLAYKNFDNSVFSFMGPQRRQVIILCGSDKSKAEILKGQIEKMIGNKYPDCFTEMDTCEQVNTSGEYKVVTSFDEIPADYLRTESLYRDICGLPSFKSDEFTRIFYYGNPDLSTISALDNFLSINLGEGGLDQVDSISKFILDEFNQNQEQQDQMSVIQIDAGTIKEKKNFNYLGKITFFIAAMLIVFSVMSISLFISNLLRSHLTRVKMNIGTYKAFGLSDREATKIYLQIMLRFIGICIGGAFLLAWACGQLLEKYISSGMRMEENIDYFSLLDWNTFILVILIIGISISVSYYHINKILSKTPGDLIYNR
jgi:ABC-type lipoprotein export system ATPase subunit